jgi:hypothetical protein
MRTGSVAGNPSIDCSHCRAAPGFRTLLMVFALAILLVLSGCATVQPIQPTRIHDAPLKQIYRAFQEGVTQAHNSTTHAWRSGWTGNIWINLADDGSRGLCYQWQQLVYRAVLPTVKQVGWHAVGIMINYDTINEHHAVVVFDPNKVDQRALLKDPEGKPAYVLDAWRRGKPDMYRLDDWLKLPLTIRVAPQLTGVRLD